MYGTRCQNGLVERGQTGSDSEERPADDKERRSRSAADKDVRCM